MAASIGQTINRRRRARFFARPGGATMPAALTTRNALGDCNAPVALRGRHRRMGFGFAALWPARRGRGRREHRPLEPDHVGQRRRRGALPLAGLDRPAWLHHAAWHLSPANDGAALVLAALLQFADAVFDFLPRRLRHSRHLRYRAARRAGLARLRAARSGPRRHLVRLGRTGRHEPHHDRGALGTPSDAWRRYSPTMVLAPARRSGGAA